MVGQGQGVAQGAAGHGHAVAHGVAQGVAQGAAGHGQGVAHGLQQAANEVWATTTIVVTMPSNSKAFFIKFSFFISLNFESFHLKFFC